MHPQNSCDLAIATVGNSTRDHRSCRTFKPLRIDLDVVFAYRLISSCSKSTTTVFSAVRCENSFLAVFLVPSGHALESAEANGSASNPRCSHAAAPCVTLQAVRPPLETHYSSACGCSFSLCYSIISAMPSTYLFVFFFFFSFLSFAQFSGTTMEAYERECEYIPYTCVYCLFMQGPFVRYMRLPQRLVKLNVTFIIRHIYFPQLSLQRATLRKLNE